MNEIYIGEVPFTIIVKGFLLEYNEVLSGDETWLRKIDKLFPPTKIGAIVVT